MATPLDERVLAVPPTRRDGEVTADLLTRAGIACVNCPSLAALSAELGRGVGAVVLTDLALLDSAMPLLLDTLASQPAWSDVPIVMLARDREAPPSARAVLGRLTNVTVLDRPVSTRSLVSTVRAALRGRQRQYQLRGHMAQQASAETALREADRRKDEFLATLAHELRNPLAPLRTGIEVLKSRAFADAPSARVIGMMERQIVMLVRLIDDLLDVARISSGKIELTLETLDLRSVLESAVEGCAPTLAAAGHVMSSQLPDEPVWVLGDRARLTQVFGNLINNACKYTPDGGRITLTLNAAGQRAQVEIQDTGVGIAPDMLDRVFEMFTQVKGSQRRAQGGLGLGLSLVKSLVEMHGGSAHATSDGPQLGSTFTITLPRVVREASELPASPLLQARPAGSRGLRVLVIDDNVDAAEVMVVSLSTLGYTAFCANSGQDGVKQARELRPDVIFCDIGMPGMNGYEVAASLRGDPALAATRLVALTGWGGAAHKERAGRAGFDGHLTKPASVEQIESMLTAAACEAGGLSKT
jgi:two-component system, sensor histidine kinase